MPISNDIDLNALGLTLGTSGASRQAGAAETQDTFLTLMMTQLQYQDPFQPLESGEFLSQLAQFETAAGVGGLQSSLNTLAESMFSSQVLESAALVGKTVFADVSTASLGAEGTVEGAIDVPAGAGSVALEVRDSAGQLVRRVEYGVLPAGRQPFVWDGLDQTGQAVPAGDYSFQASIQAGGVSQAGRVLLADQVRSVTLGGGGQQPMLNLAGGGQISFSQILEIR